MKKKLLEVILEKQLITTKQYEEVRELSFKKNCSE